MKRLFAAIPIHLTRESIDSLNQLQEKLKVDKIKWVDLYNTHLTIKFFGETPDDQIDDICDALDMACSGVEPFEMKINRLGIFGSRYNPKVIWLGFEENQEIIRLQQNIAAELEKIGIYEDRQNFVPHLTIGRVKQLHQKKFFQEMIDKFKTRFSQKNEIKNFHLLESILKPSGPEYHIVETFKFEHK
ncbi:MAG: RNA 2',3'-cyclic phosphodiesterase [Bacteroidales bacterium]|nr:RNA 2',3'-cyclic phosphodiesterase [Bacteroidales bacterium]